MNPEPVFLSQAHVTDREVEAVVRAVRGGWVTPLGPEVDAFEAELGAFVGVGHAVALSSGTAALELGLKGLGVSPGDEVVVPTLTFAATAFAAVHIGAKPVFVDVERVSWNLDPELLDTVLSDKAARNALPAAVVPVDLLGRTADYDALLPICQRYDVPVLADAAESLGARYRASMAGSQGQAAAFSFNGNKIMTTSGGGMLVSDDEQLVEKARFWSTQAREPYPWYEHEEIGYNYRLSNVLAALGRAQLARLPQMIQRRAQIHDMYQQMLADVPGVSVTNDPPWGESNHWLTSILLDAAHYPADSNTALVAALSQQWIEVRPIWKPMHQQPVFADAQSHLSGVADDIFARGVCLPSGAGLGDAAIERVAHGVREVLASL